MGIIAVVMRELIAAGVTGDALVTAIERIEASLDPVVSAGAARTRRWRAKNEEASQASQASQNVTCDGKERSPTPPKEIYISKKDTTEVGKEEKEEKSKKEQIPTIRAREIIELFETRFWSAFPKRDGANPKSPARKSFLAAVKHGHDPEKIIGGAERCRDSARASGIEGTKYAPQAVTWLNQARWEDYPEGSTDPPAVSTGWRPGMPTDEELRAKYGKPNGQQDAETGGGVRSAGDGIHREPIESPRQREERRDFPDNQTRKPGMATLGSVLSRISGLRSVGDAAGEGRAAGIDDGSDAMAGMVRQQLHG